MIYHFYQGEYVLLNGINFDGEGGGGDLSKFH